MSVYDSGSPPQSWLRASDIVSRNIAYCKPSENATDIYCWMEANDFDIAFIEGDFTRIVYRNDLQNANSKEKIDRHIRPLPSDSVECIHTSMNEAFRILEKKPWFLLLNGQNLIGIVTREDTSKPAASAFVLAHLITLERVLRRLLGTYSNTPMADEPLVTERDSSVDRTGIHYLSELVNAVAKNQLLIKDLGLQKKEFKNRGQWAVRFRSHLAHARRFDYDHPQSHEPFSRFRHLQLLLQKAIELIEDREQIWSAIGETVILDRTGVNNRVYAGKNASQLPFGPPVYVITAANPFEQKLSPNLNAKRNSMLERILRRRTSSVLPVIGQSPCGKWSENSFMIAGLTELEVLDIAQRFGQRGVFKLSVDEKCVIATDQEVKHRSPRAS